MMACLCRRLGWRVLYRQLLGPTHHTQKTPAATVFWEPHIKAEYEDRVKIKKSRSEHVKEGLGLLKTEMGKFAEETKTKFRVDGVYEQWHGDYEVVWKFNTKDIVDSWIVTTDSDLGEGKSTAEFALGPNETALFSGELKTDPPKDGVIKSAGYCHARCQRKRKSFKREDVYNWLHFSHLLMRVRGDGRAYQIILSMDRYFDVQWNDQYQYALFTRGGPYWQVAKIPFSKFYLGAKGRIQDKQEPVQLHQITSIGITCSDDVPGPFQLEIDYIGVIFDEGHKQEFAYEMYETEPWRIY